MPICPSCGMPLSENIASCNYCGFRIAPPLKKIEEQQNNKNEVFTENFLQTNYVFDSIFRNKSSIKINYLRRLINILTNYKNEWRVINDEDSKESDAIKHVFYYIVLLTILETLFNSFKFVIIHSDNFFWSVLLELRHSFFSIVISSIVLAKIIDWLAPTCDSEKKFLQSFQLAIYSYTPLAIMGIASIFGIYGLIIIFIVIIYSFIILYHGLTVMKKTPFNKRVKYILSIILVIIAVTVIGIIIWGLLVYSIIPKNIG